MESIFYGPLCAPKVILNKKSLIISETRDYYVVTFSPNEETNHEYLNKFNILRKFASKPNINKRWTNYLPNRLDAIKQIGITLLINKKSSEPFGMSSIFRNSNYTNNIVRILNRNFIIPEERLATTLNGHMPFSYVMAEQQINFLQDTVDFAFISMEYPKYNLMNKWQQGAKAYMKRDWVHPRGRFLVCPNPDSEKCWQHVAYTQLIDSPNQVFENLLQKKL